jgi:DNA-directed RNA polymerase specialized sigma54-like protein
MQLEPLPRPEHVLRASTKLITSSAILHLTAEELEHAIDQEQEEPKRRLSDEELAQLIQAQGIPMARRTVTKYREEMGIGSSRER